MVYLKKMTAVLLAALMILTGCEAEQAVEASPKKYEGELYSCKKLEGRTVIVTLFCSTYSTSWDPESEEDIAKIEQIRQYMGMATDWISEEAARYGCNAEFIYDWAENPELMGFRGIPENSIEHIYGKIRALKNIEITIDHTALMEKYNADNIAYYVIGNTDSVNPGNSVAYASRSEDVSDKPFETVFLSYYSGIYEAVSGPSTYAHELLHLFGALDFYQPSSKYSISEDFVSYVAENYPDEIMLDTRNSEGGYDYDVINKEITPLTAYYLGLTDELPEREKFGLIISEHIKK